MRFGSGWLRFGSYCAGALSYPTRGCIRTHRGCIIGHKVLHHSLQGLHNSVQGLISEVIQDVFLWARCMRMQGKLALKEAAKLLPDEEVKRMSTKLKRKGYGHEASHCMNARPTLTPSLLVRLRQWKRPPRGSPALWCPGHVPRFRKAVKW